MKDHTFLVREGRWQIAGSTVDVAANANIAVGVAVVTHSGGVWLLDQQLNELQNRYSILALADGAPATAFTGVNGVMGELKGTFVFFDDLILVQYASTDGQYSGCEALRHIGDAEYEWRGALFRNGGHVTSWSCTLVRA